MPMRTLSIYTLCTRIQHANTNRVYPIVLLFFMAVINYFSGQLNVDSDDANKNLEQNKNYVW